MYIIPHKIASNYPSKRSHSFTGNGARAGSSRRADEVRGFSETGYSYFGARYYDSDLSGLFLSVDPMSDKYPSLSPYAYCMWNPVKLVDPKGLDTIFSFATRLIDDEQNKSNLDILTWLRNEGDIPSGIPKLNSWFPDTARSSSRRFIILISSAPFELTLQGSLHH